MRKFLYNDGNSNDHPSESDNIIQKAQPTNDPHLLTHLRRNWLWLAMLWAIIWLGGYQLLLPIWPYAEQWLLLSALVLALGLWILWRNLPHNHRPGETTLLPGFGPGNQLTLLRALAIGLLAGFLFAPWPMGRLAWVIVLIYTTASIADYFDGVVARLANHATVLGRLLDMEFDGLGVVVVSLLAIGYGQLPWWFVAIGLARYFFIGGVWWRRRSGLPNYDLPPSVFRRVMAGILMGMLTVVLWPIVPAAMTRIGGVVIGVPLLIGFVRDWLIVCGWLNPQNVFYNRLRQKAYHLLARQMPPVWRLMIALCMAAILATVDDWQRPLQWQMLLLSWGLPAVTALATVLSVTAVAGTVLIFLGILGRLAAIFLLLPIGFDIATQGLWWANMWALVGVLWIVSLGTGWLSIWQPEEVWFGRRGAAEEAGDGGLAHG